MSFIFKEFKLGMQCMYPYILAFFPSDIYSSVCLSELEKCNAFYRCWTDVVMGWHLVP